MLYKMSKNDEFYMVLPSNASPNTYPNNNASDFRVCWDQPIVFDPKDNWKVALTDISYIYHPHTITTEQSISYSYYTTEAIPVMFTVKFVKWKDHPIKITPNELTSRVTHLVKNVTIHLKVEGTQLIASSDTLFKIECKKLGFDNSDAVKVTTNEYPFHSFVAKSTLDKDGWDKFFDVFADAETAVEVIFYHRHPHNKTFRFDRDVHLSTAKQVETFLRDKCQDIFKMTASDQGKRLSFQLAKEIFHVRFYGGLNFVLGYRETDFSSDTAKHNFEKFLIDQDPTIYRADFAPQFKRGVKNIYIYASCCEAIHVGHTKVPLLRNIFVDATKDVDKHGHVRYTNIHNPMYINVASSIMNEININLRNDAGYLVGFPKEAITILTLHFKKFNSYKRD